MGSPGRRNTIITYLLVFASVIFVVIGQILLKYGMMNMGQISLTRDSILLFLENTVSSPLIICGFALYLISSLIWLIAISREELSFVQPLTATSYILILLFSRLLFNENVSPLRISGVLLVSVGVFLVARSG
jgi:drug/metabolite transporter (DMT)-like permease